MTFKFDNDRPIYKQLVDNLKQSIIRGEFALGERIPSVRDLALKTKVNPNTMQRALQELEEEGFIKTERTTGKYVTEDKDFIKQKKEEFAKVFINNYFDSMQFLGFTLLEAKEKIENGKEE